MQNRLILILGLSLSFIFSCQDREKLTPAPDVSHIQLSDFNLVRFDQEIKKIDANKISESYKEVLYKYPKITDLYFKRLLEIPFENQDTFYAKVKEILTAEEIIAVQDTIDFYYPDVDEIEDELQQACRYLKHYFPQFIPPNYYTIQSEFGYQNFIFEDTNKDGVGIGLDLFLGEDFGYKYLDPTNPSFSQYLTRTYNKEHLVKKTIELSIVELIGDPPGKRFIDYIVNSGKKLYILQHVLPATPDSIIMEYTGAQMEWVKSNELEMWSYFLDNDIIYETNHLKINKYISASPNSPGMPPEAPGQTGNFIGLQIVKAFMKRHPETTFEELIAMKDSQKLMELSKYKPKRR